MISIGKQNNRSMFLCQAPTPTETGFEGECCINKMTGPHQVCLCAAALSERSLQKGVEKLSHPRAVCVLCVHTMHMHAFERGVDILIMSVL